MSSSACHKMRKIWRSSIQRNLKVRLFFCTELKPGQWSRSCRMDGCYTKLLRMALDVSWRQMIQNTVL